MRRHKRNWQPQQSQEFIRLAKDPKVSCIPRSNYYWEWAWVCVTISIGVQLCICHIILFFINSLVVVVVVVVANLYSSSADPVLGGGHVVAVPMHCVQQPLNP